MIRHNWTKEEILDIYNTPLLDLVYRAASVHREHNTYGEVQVSSLLSIKTGGCSEDCSYCPQSAKYHTDIDIHALVSTEEVVTAAMKAKEGGASRLCMGAAWREVRDNRDFDRILEMVKAVAEMDMEVCCTLGMINESQAKKLADAGLYAYNHNLDSSEDFYKKIISTRSYADRLQTLGHVRKAGLSVCCGGIIGMGESAEDRASMLQVLSAMNPHPESVPVNALVPVKGTPLESNEKISTWEMVRMIATVRIVLPASAVRLSAGRTEMSTEAQALCFMAGANSVFAGDKLLTTPNPAFNEDLEMFTVLGLKPMQAYSKAKKESGIPA